MPTIYPIDSPNSAMRDLTGLNLEGGYCYTLCNTAPELQSPLPPDPRSIHSILKPLCHFWNSICPTLPNSPHPMPIPGYPDQGFHNPVLDLLIPLLHLQPCIVPHSYKNESPMYCRPSLNINYVSPLSHNPLTTLSPFSFTSLTLPLTLKSSPTSLVRYTSRSPLVHPTSVLCHKIQDQMIQGGQHIS